MEYWRFRAMFAKYINTKPDYEKITFFRFSRYSYGIMRRL